MAADEHAGDGPAEPSDGKEPEPESAPDELAADEIVAAAGPVDEDKRVQVALEDGRTLVARVRSVQEGDIECTVDGCLHRFDSERAFRTHIGRAHPEATARTCPECGDDFSVSPSEPHVYCSDECRVAATRQRKVCPGCQREFVTHPEGTQRERTYCSTWCSYEDRRDEPRPDTYTAARQELEDDGHEGEALVGRLQAVLGPEWHRESVRIRHRVTEDDVAYREAAAELANVGDVDVDAETLGRRYIRDVIEADPDVSNRLAVDDVLEVVAEAGTMMEASDGLRLNRAKVRNLLSRLGVRDEVDSFDARRVSASRATEGGDAPGDGSGEGDDDGGDGSGEDVPVWDRHGEERL